MRMASTLRFWPGEVSFINFCTFLQISVISCLCFQHVNKCWDILNQLLLQHLMHYMSWKGIHLVVCSMYASVIHSHINNGRRVLRISVWTSCYVLASYSIATSLSALFLQSVMPDIGSAIWNNLIDIFKYTTINNRHRPIFSKVD